MSEYIPDSTSDGLREILLGCLNMTPSKIVDIMLLTDFALLDPYNVCTSYKSAEKRMPISILITSPWFLYHKITNIDVASKIMKEYLNDKFYPVSFLGDEAIH